MERAGVCTMPAFFVYFCVIKHFFEKNADFFLLNSKTLHIFAIAKLNEDIGLPVGHRILLTNYIEVGFFYAQ